MWCNKCCRSFRTVFKTEFMPVFIYLYGYQCYWFSKYQNCSGEWVNYKKDNLEETGKRYLKSFNTSNFMFFLAHCRLVWQ